MYGTYGANVSYVSFWSRAAHCTTYVCERTRVHVREIRFGELRTSKTQITGTYMRTANKTLGLPTFPYEFVGVFCN